MTTTLFRASTQRLIDEQVESYDVTDSIVLVVDADARAVLEALEGVDFAARAVRALDSLGVARRLAFGPATLAVATPMERVFGLLWRVEEPRAAEAVDAATFAAFETPGYLKVVWDVRVTAAEEGRALLSATIRFAATDEVTRARLLDGWGPIGPTATELVRRALAAVTRHAEDRADPAAEARRTVPDLRDFARPAW